MGYNLPGLVGIDDNTPEGKVSTDVGRGVRSLLQVQVAVLALLGSRLL